MFNLKVLFSLPSDVHTFDATDEGDIAGIQCPAERVVLFKPGCKVMLLWNKSENLRNGSQGRFVGVWGNNVIAHFEGVGETGEKGNMDKDIQKWRCGAGVECCRKKVLSKEDLSILYSSHPHCAIYILL